MYRCSKLNLKSLSKLCSNSPAGICDRAARGLTKALAHRLLATGRPKALSHRLFATGRPKALAGLLRVLWQIGENGQGESIASTSRPAVSIPLMPNLQNVVCAKDGVYLNTRESSGRCWYRGWLSVSAQPAWQIGSRRRQQVLRVEPADYAIVQTTTWPGRLTS